MPSPRERFLEALLESATDYAIIATDLQGRVTAWNEGACRILGWTEAEMLGRQYGVFFTDEDRRDQVPEAEMAAALARGRGIDERWHVRRDGSRFWANGEMMPLRDEGGAIEGFLKILRDRTTQEVAAERQRTDAAFLRSVLQSSADCIKVLDLDAKLLFMNEGGRQVMEVSDFGVIEGCPWLDFWPGNEEARAAIAAARVGQTGHFQGLANTAAGTPRYWDVQVTPILDGAGRPEKLLTVSRDITATRNAETALREAQGLNTLILNSSRDCIVVVDLEGRTQYVSPGGVESMEVADVDAIIGLSWLRVWTGPDHQAAIDAVAEARAGGVGRFQGFCATHKGTPKWWDVVISPLPGPDGRPERLVSVGRDITSRMEAERRLGQSEEQLRTLAASLAQQVAERTADRNRLWELSTDLIVVARFDSTITATNPAWFPVLGWTETELAGANLLDLIHPDDREHAVAAAAALSIGETRTRVEHRYRHKDGSYRWIAWAAVPGGELINAVGRDITAEKERAEALRHAEEALRQAQKMEAVGQLTGGIAHDFNNLLAGILGSLELLQTRIAQGRTAELGRYVSGAQGAAQRAAALTQRLLAFSRRQTLDPKPISVNRLIHGMEDLIGRTMGPAITLEVAGAAGLWTTLCDPNQLENALLNLCINARDAMPAGGRLTIETANATLDEHAAKRRDVAPGQYVALCVTDTGAGIPADVIERVFDPFFTTKPLGEGTGLGLSMVYGFAKQSGGQARVYSEPGKGTTVKIYLPRAALEAETETGPGQPRAAGLDSAPRAGHDQTVLIIDDETTVRMLMVEAMRDLGYATLDAGNGPDGLRILESGAQIDLLITDVGLPGGMNGRQLADAARVSRPELRVLFITGYAEVAAIGNGQVPFGMHVMTKPFAMEALAAKVNALLTVV